MRNPRSVAAILIVLTLAALTLAVPAGAATKLAASFGVECPDATRPGMPAHCWVHIEPHPLQDAPQPTGTLTFSVPSTKGSLSTSSCDAAQGSCTVTYTPTGAGTSWRKDTITASYSGDSVWASQRKYVVIAVPDKLPVDFRAVCQSSSTLPQAPLQCTIYVNPAVGHNPSPTGTVGFTVPSYKGTVSPTSCTLVDQSCTFSYTPTGAGSATRKDTITATYFGDADWAPSTTTVVVAVPKRLPVYLATYCDQVSTTPGVQATCHLDIAPTASGPTPTGSVAVTVSSYRGTVSPSSCAAAAGSCSYAYTPTGTGSEFRKDTITVFYPGDSFWAPAKATVVMAVPAA